MAVKPGGYIGRFLLGLALLGWALLAAAAELAATVVFASGSPRIVDVAGAERAASKGAELRAGETLETRDGIVQLRFRDGASMSLQKATRFRVDDYVFAGEGQGGEGDRGFFSLIRGGFRTITGLIGKVRRDQYRVNTPVAAIGIRGTHYHANLDDSGLTVGTTAGLVAVCNDTGCVEVRPGETVFVAGQNVRPRLQSRAASRADEAPVQPGLRDPSFGSAPASPAAPAGVTPSPSTPSSPTFGPSTPSTPTMVPSGPNSPSQFQSAPTGPTAAPTAR